MDDTEWNLEDDETETADEMKTYYTPIYVITAFFGTIGIFGPLTARKCTNKGIIRCCIMLTAFCMWIFWLTVYIAQMNPLIGPRMHRHVVAWMAYKWVATLFIQFRVIMLKETRLHLLRLAQQILGLAQQILGLAQQILCLPEQLESLETPMATHGPPYG